MTATIGTPSRIDTNREKDLLIYAITNTRFLQQIIPDLDETNVLLDYSSWVIKQVKSYYWKYKKAPGQDMQRIYDNDSVNMDDARASLISTFLERISDRAESEDFQPENIEMVVDDCKNYLRQIQLRKLGEYLIGATEGRANANMLGAIDEMMHRSRRSAPSTTEIIDFHNTTQMFDFLEDHKDYLFKLQGPLGNRVGYFQREWVVTFLSFTSMGKTWNLINAAIQAGHREKGIDFETDLNVLFVTLEQSVKQIKARFAQAVLSLAAPADPVQHQRNPNEKVGVSYRMFHCERYKKCELERKLVDSDACSVCYGEKGSQYIQSYVDIDEDYHRISATNIGDGRRKEKPQDRYNKVKNDNFGGRLFIMSKPRNATNMEMIEAEIDRLSDEDIYIDVVAIDYGDLLIPNRRGIISTRDRHEAVWNDMTEVAQRKKCCVLTATQSQRKKPDVNSISLYNVGEDIRKANISDVVIGLVASNRDKKNGVVRMNILKHRHHGDDPTQYIVHHCYAIGQAILECQLKGKIYDAQSNAAGVGDDSEDNEDEEFSNFDDDEDGPITHGRSTRLN